MRNRYQENTTRLYPRNRPQPKPTKNQVKIIKKFQINSSEQHKRNTSHTSPQNNELINKIFTTLNYSYPMKIALIKKKPQKQQYHPKS